MVEPWQDVPLAAGQLQRVAERRRDEAWLAEAFTAGHLLLIDNEGRCFVDVADGGQCLVVASDFVTATSGWPTQASSEVDQDLAPRRFLGVHEGVPYFAATLSELEVAALEREDGSRQWLGLRELAPQLSAVEAEIVTTAVALQHWHRRHQFCPHCGAATEQADAGWLRVCTADGTPHFPRTDPAVIMLVHDGGDRVLLGRGASWPAGRFSTLAGFVEPGESLEAAVTREVLEETGAAIRDVRYLASQPWPFPASLMLGFTARGDAEAPLAVDTSELAEASWFSRSEVLAARLATDATVASPNSSVLQFISPRLSISRYLIDQWLAETAG